MSNELTPQELYQKTRDDLLRRQLSNNENFDRSILTLASGALALTITFINGDRELHCFPMLVLSWIGFIVAIVSTILSYIASQRGIDKQLELAERYYLKQDDGALNATNLPAKINEILGYVSATSFILGIIFLLIFFGTNLK
ncbi:MAG: hypothetical protein JNK57_10915 [Planctomycetaceae bacterium]|nr:hypothetical protein [Planctomycetaceae bacterium]